MRREIVLLFGGASSERRVSVASAQHVAAVLPEARPWFWAPDGAVHEIAPEALAAIPRPFEEDFSPGTRASHPTLDDALDRTGDRTIFFLALHGGSGEDGTVQDWLEERGLLFTGSGSRASRNAFDKGIAKRLVSHQGFRSPESVDVRGEEPDAARRALESMLARFRRVVLKPVADGSSADLRFIDDDAGIRSAVERVRERPRVRYLCEAFVDGRELTVGVVDEDDSPRALPSSEVRLERGRSFDYAGKYLGAGSREITPAEVSAAAEGLAGRLALAAHRATGCRGYSRTDLILRDGSDGPEVVFLEINSLPGLTRASFIPQQLAAAGISMRAFVEAQLAIACATIDSRCAGGGNGP